MTFYLQNLQLIALTTILSKCCKSTSQTENKEQKLEMLFGVPRDSKLGPLLFNILYIDMFYNINDCDIASYADNNTPNACSSN